VGAAGVDCARIDWHNCAAWLDRWRTRARRAAKKEILRYDDMGAAFGRNVVSAFKRTLR
jgi:uncharacterized ferredoxin-like protein